jgi:hypothetical protein
MIFGVVLNSAESNDIVITATVQGFDLKIYAQHEVQIRSDPAKYPEVRKSKMEELARGILPRANLYPVPPQPVAANGSGIRSTPANAPAGERGTGNVIYQIPPGWQKEELASGAIRLTPVNSYGSGRGVILILPAFPIERSFHESFDEVVRGLGAISTEAVREIKTDEGFDVLFVQGNLGRNYGTTLNPQIQPEPFKFVACNPIDRFESVLLVSPYMFGEVEQAFDFVIRSLDYHNHRNARARSPR